MMNSSLTLDFSENHPRVYTELDTDPVTRTFIFAAAESQ